jgi:hypothetical protein
VPVNYYRIILLLAITHVVTDDCEREHVVYLGEQLLKLKEYQDPKTRKIIEEGINDGKKALEEEKRFYSKCKG